MSCAVASACSTCGSRSMANCTRRTRICSWRCGAPSRVCNGTSAARPATSLMRRRNNAPEAAMAQSQRKLWRMPCSCAEQLFLRLLAPAFQLPIISTRCSAVSGADARQQTGVLQPCCTAVTGLNHRGACLQCQLSKGSTICHMFPGLTGVHRSQGEKLPVCRTCLPVYHISPAVPHVALPRIHPSAALIASLCHTAVQILSSCTAAQL
jgi:hypothetical protein